MESLYSITSDVKEATKVIMNNMMKTRPRGTLKYRPYRVSEAISHNSYLSWEKVDLKKIYPDVKVGDCVYIGMNLVSGATCRAGLSVLGNARVFLEGTEISHSFVNAGGDSKAYYLDVKEGSNNLVLLCQCDDEESFTIAYVPSTAQYFGMWAKDYLLYLGVFSPVKEFSAEEGIGVSRLYRGGLNLPEDISKLTYVWPTIEHRTPDLDMDAIFPEGKGMVSYALTYALEDTVLNLWYSGRVKIFINGKLEETSCGIKVKQGDTILLKFVRENGLFGKLEYEADSAIGIPFMECNRGVGDKWLTIGTFGSGSDAGLPLGPEQEIQFVKPYLDYEWKQVFWNLSTKDDCLRPYMDTFFFSQWFYAIMVGHYGILQAAKLLENEEYLNYFIDSISYMTKFFEYANYEYKRFNSPTFIGRARERIHLDNIGTMGMNIAELYKLTGDRDALYVLKMLDESIRENISRFEDGTFYRNGKHNPRIGGTMWADDTFMCCPLLARMGLVFDDKKYFEDCVTQIRGFKKRLYRPKAKIYSHILYIDQGGEANEVSWSRGNGWIFSTLADMADKIPEDVEGRDEVLQIYREFAESLLQYQDEEGLWHQVIDHPDSYQETSGSTMFLWGLCRGINSGLLEREKYIDSVRRAYNGLLKNKIDNKGNIYGVCRGSGLSKDVEYYKQLGELTNDDHGTGLVLAAFEEYSRVENMD